MSKKDVATRRLLSLPIDDQRIGFSVRVINIFESAGIRTLFDLMNYSVEDLYNLRGFGDTSRIEVRKVLSTIGLRLKDDHPLPIKGDICPFCGHRIEG